LYAKTEGGTNKLEAYFLSVCWQHYLDSVLELPNLARPLVESTISYILNRTQVKNPMNRE